MLKNLEQLVKEAARASEEIKAFHGQIRIVSHYDADGICSAAIMAHAMKRAGKDFHLSFVQQISCGLLEELRMEKRRLMIFLDLGSGYLDSIKTMLPDATVIICDHHQPMGVVASNVIHINSVAAGIDNNISGAGVTYLLARAMSRRNMDISHLAIVGAIGDSQIDSVGQGWGLNGLNREIIKEAEDRKKLSVSKGLRIWGRYRRPVHKAIQYSIDPYIPEVSGSESRSVQFLNEIGIPIKKPNGDWMTISDLSLEQQKRLATEIIKERIRKNHSNPEKIFGDVYELLDKPDVFRDASEFATVLNACGKMKKAYLGVSICLNDPKSFQEVEKVLETYRREVGRAISWIYRQIEKKSKKYFEGKGIYIICGSRVSEHIISNAISTVNHSGALPDKPLFGIADSEHGVKISARASQKLVDSGLNLSVIMNAAASAFGGEGGGHIGAAGAFIPKEKVPEFIEFSERMIAEKL
jgi:RecJ-like exonuclease